MYLEQKLEEMSNDIKEIKEMLFSDMRTINSQKLVGVEEIARMFNVSRQTLYTSKRYKLPDFGEKLSSSKKNAKWSLEEVINWNKQPEKELKRRYENLGKAQ